MDLLEAAMRADNLQLDADDLGCPEQSAIVTEENFPVVAVNKESTNLCASETEVTTRLAHFEKGVSGQYGCENMEEGQPFSDGNAEIIPVATVNKDKIDMHETVMEETIPTKRVSEEKTDSGKFIMKGNIPNVTKKPIGKRRGPNKKPVRKRFIRRKRQAEKEKKLRALKALSANQEVNEVDSSVVPEAVSSQFAHTDKSDPTGGQKGNAQPLMTMIKEEPSSPTGDSISTCQPSVKSSGIRVRKIIFKRDTHRPGIIVGTPVNIQNSISNKVCSSQPQPPNSNVSGVQNPKIHPIHKLKSVFMKCFKKPVSTSSSRCSSIRNLQHPIAKIHAGNPVFQKSISEKIISTPELHSVKSDVGHNFKSTSLEGTTEQIPSSKEDDQRGNFCESISGAAITHIIQPTNISIQPGLTLSKNSVREQSEYMPPTSLSFSINGISNRRMLDSAEGQQANVQSTEQLLESVGKTLAEVIPPPWITVLKHNGIALCLLSHSNIVTIQRSLLVEANGKVTVAVHGKELPPENPFWQFVKPVELQPDTVKQFISHIEHLLCRLRWMEVCKAVEDFEPFWKPATYWEIDMNRFHEMRFTKCCRSLNCHLLVNGLHYKRCKECSKLWRTLRKRASDGSKKPDKALSRNKPFKYLTSPEKRERFDMAVKEIRRLKAANKRLIEKLNAATSEDRQQDFPVAPEEVLPEETAKGFESDSDFEWPESDDPAS